MGDPKDDFWEEPEDFFYSSRCMSLMLEKNPSLTKEVDSFGWSALHYTARFNRFSWVEKLLSEDPSMAYMIAHNDDNKTALHVAVCHGSLKVMHKIASTYPDCWEMVTAQRKNILHLAVEYEQEAVLKEIMMSYPWAVDLLNQKDADGNTPLHLYAASNRLSGDTILTHPQVLKNMFNKSNLTPLDVATYAGFDLDRHRKTRVKERLEKAGALPGLRNVITQDKETKMAKSRASKSYAARIQGKKAEEDGEIKQEIIKRLAEAEEEILQGTRINVPDDETAKQDLPKVADTHLIVATLVATCTFAAGFTVPGGYNGGGDPNPGMAILIKRAAFAAFIITDTVAMVTSTAAVFIHFMAPFYSNQRKLVRRYRFALVLILIAMAALAIAFVTGLVVVLPHSLGLTIAVSVIGGLLVPVFLFVLLENFYGDPMRNAADTARTTKEKNRVRNVDKECYTPCDLLSGLCNPTKLRRVEEDDLP